MSTLFKQSADSVAIIETFISGTVKQKELGNTAHY